MQDKLLEMLMQKDELTWQTILYDLVKTEKMDPWDIDISKLVFKYMETVKKLQEHNFFISGKVILAASLLLRIKSTKLLEEYLPNFDAMLFPPDEDLLEDQEQEQIRRDYPNLLLKTPQPRKRKIDLNNLIQALNKALDVEKRREVRRADEAPIREIELPKNNVSITILIKELYTKIKQYFQKRETITFSELVPSDKKQDKVLTFIPLLHLDTQNKIDVNQEIPFGEIYISRFKEQQPSQQNALSSQKTP